MRTARVALALLLAGGLGGALDATAHDSHPSDSAPAPVAAFETRFVPPEPGSYELPPIGHVTDHRLLATTGERAPMLDLAPGQVALVSFVYASCPEGWGCPFSLAVFQQLDRQIEQDPELRHRVRLVTVSFDPARDTPERMAGLREQLRPATEWRFLTAGSLSEVQPALEDYGQDVLPLIDAQGAETGVMRHVLKVFLVDSERAIRNIYSVGFLSPSLLLADVRTLLMRDAESPTATE